jgi:hypothetical protein
LYLPPQLNVLNGFHNTKVTALTEGFLACM